ncbi:FKBP-type peptidyl-prolyl cis-trans isomerase [Actomonas aquatica]|uniref:Peptidyl-prolyl cis-trans isomerase n=1 Tax=Actomonas aquatica TaxID=2866162 RepID=A0ABZ1C408_9BACT|nr:FKBP-type peptidyl-prolyl cis-trans isomerase [Opitutus sp. WL0086]WRQ86105.1 FKBP-type peptidyl-prolyl cis-trans isomerase [Opitutus sp. WL0086]
MKGTIVAIVLLVAAAAGVWWYADQRNARIAAEREAARVAAEQAVRDERLELFGEEALAEGIAWTDSGLGILHLESGSGAKPYPGAYVKFKYRVRLKDGTEVQREDKPTEARIGQMIPGVSSGLQQMLPGGRAILFIPPRLGYGGSAYGPIPPNSGLVFEVELLKP